VISDGVIGPQTLAALEARDAAEVHNKLAVARSLRLVRWTQKNPDQLVFLAGWMNRTLSFVS
jgi:lysozyme family protein